MPLALAVASSLFAARDWQGGGEVPPVVLFRPTPHFDPARVSMPRATAGLELGRLPVAAVLAPGQSLSGLLAAVGVHGADAVPVVAALGEHLDVRRLRPGLALVGYQRPTDGTTRLLEIEMPGRGRLRLAVADDGGWSSRFEPFEEHVEVQRVAGVVDGSLAGAMLRAGASEAVAYRLADVLRWDVDFNRDLRSGDRFQVLYEEVWVDGELARIGDVVAAAMWNRGRLVEAYRFGDDYFDAEGRPLKKMFLRSPMTFSRITSGFSQRRFHPVLKRYRPHYGVDYGAPVGTPVRVTASGVVVHAGWDGGGGKTIKVRHANGYLTAYLHLSGYAEGIRSGRRVSQGDVIGYVGATGLATGPHLDYRVQHHGHWIDPQSLRTVPAEPVTAERLPTFLAWRDGLRHALATGAPVAPAPPLEDGPQLAAAGAATIATAGR